MPISDEPRPPQPGDITDLAGLDGLDGCAVKFTEDGGETWQLGVLWGPAHMYQHVGFGLGVDLQLAPDGVSCNSALTDRKFEAGLIVRVAQPADYSGVTFSYGSQPWTPWVPTWYPSSSEHPVHRADWDWGHRRDSTYRQCSYCGCIHPEDLNDAEWNSGEWAIGKFGQKYYVVLHDGSPQGRQVKFYTQHLADPDLGQGVRDSLQRRLERRFEFRDGMVRGQPYS